MANYSIKDLEELTGIKAHTIRIWEKRYNIVTPGRTPTNIRLYSDNDLKKILNISILNRSGFKISHLAVLNDDELKDKVIHLSKKKVTTAVQIENLLISMVELDEWKFEKIISDSVIKKGFENTLTELIYPFFEKIGLLWQTGSISPAQEHFVSNLLRQKIIAAIDGHPPVREESKHTFILFLHEKELHELGLLYYSYLLKKQGIKTIYLGQAVPFENLKNIAGIDNIQFLLTSFMTGTTVKFLREYLNELSDTFSSKTIFFTGYQTSKIDWPLPDNLVMVKSISHFKKILKTLDQFTGNRA